MTIESIKFAEIIEAGNLIRKVFDEFSAAEYSSAGISHFYEKITEYAIRERFLMGSMINAAKINNRIVGYIEVINSSHIYLLFIKKDYQKKGLGTKLIDFSIDLLKKNNPQLRNITVNSTESAVKVYEKLGFRKLADLQFKNDIISYPMVLEI